MRFKKYKPRDRKRDKDGTKAKRRKARAAKKAQKRFEQGE